MSRLRPAANRRTVDSRSRLLLAVLLAVNVAGISIEAARPYHPETIASLKASRHTHVRVCGWVRLSKREADGDRHLRLSSEQAATPYPFIVAEIVPFHPLAVPRLGEHVCVSGIRRIDNEVNHGWPEIHPAERIEVLR